MDGPVGPRPGVDAQLLLIEHFTEATVTALRHSVSTTVAATGLSGDTAEDFVLAVHELVTNAVRHGGGAGRLEIRILADVLTCEVADDGQNTAGLPVQLSAANVPGGRGLWLAQHLTGSLMLVRRPDGVSASVSRTSARWRGCPRRSGCRRRRSTGTASAEHRLRTLLEGLRNERCEVASRQLRPSGQVYPSAGPCREFRPQAG